MGINSIELTSEQHLQTVLSATSRHNLVVCVLLYWNNSGLLKFGSKYNGVQSHVLEELQNG
jgi:hypothetical protein